ncbi:MAG: DUF2304 domain-containing protein [Candidatus Moranbacteria bacterium]|nr:DUF2304 domain-containing protein [Candidatus Moranbacteria bacterium]
MVYAPATLFLILILGFFFIMLHYSIIVSEITEKNKVLIQEVGILKYELKKIRECVKNMQH